MLLGGRLIDSNPVAIRMIQTNSEEKGLSVPELQLNCHVLGIVHDPGFLVKDVHGLL